MCASKPISILSGVMERERPPGKSPRPFSYNCATCYALSGSVFSPEQDTEPVFPIVGSRSPFPCGARGESFGAIFPSHAQYV